MLEGEMLNAFSYKNRYQMLTSLVLRWFLIYLITTPAVFLNQTHLVILGIFHLELGKNILFGFGNGAEFRPQILEIESPVHYQVPLNV